MSNRYRWVSSFRSGRVAAAAALALTVGVGGCTSTQLDGESPAALVIVDINAASGAEPDEFGGTLSSDVITLIQVGEDEDGNPLVAPTIFEDLFEAEFALRLKDPGSATAPTVPTSANWITITRYRVDFVRADGRNTPGVDVPYGFDGAFTVTVSGDSAIGAGVLVRGQAKQEAPLMALASNGGANTISTIARVTFYGHDQAGRAVSATGQIGVNFADWGDPD